jgi:hypothetical protein
MFDIPDAAVVAADGLIRLAPIKNEAFALVLIPYYYTAVGPLIKAP